MEWISRDFIKKWRDAAIHVLSLLIGIPPTASFSRHIKSPGRLLSTGKFNRRRMTGTEMIP